MKTIALLTIIAVLAQNIFGTKSSVGGPLTDLLILFIATLAVGIHESWAKMRGPFGSLLNIVASVIGGFVAASLFSVAVETILTLIHFEGTLVSSHHPMRYISEGGMAIFTVLGSWITLQIVWSMLRIVTRFLKLNEGSCGDA